MARNISHWHPLRLHLWGGVPNAEFWSMGGGAKLRIFIYGGCQDYREKIDFLPSAAGDRKKFLAYKTNISGSVSIWTIQKCNKNRNPMNLGRNRWVPRKNFRFLAPSYRGCQTQNFHLWGGAKLRIFIYGGCHARCFGAFAWVCIRGKINSPP